MGDEGASPNNSGHGGNKRYCHSTGHNQSIFNWTSNSTGGYFKDGRNVVECVGEELYCFIEERAQFGQIIGITAGCEQMMNHPAVAIVNQQTSSDINAVKNNYNQEAARGGTNFHGLKSFYGIGGCLSMPAQNGHEYVQQSGPDQTTGTDSANWTTSKWNNYYRFFHGGFGQNQCLRFPNMNGATDAQREELVPRFDMANQAQEFSTTGANNNLFVHASHCGSTGRARGCGGINACAQNGSASGGACP